MLWERGLRSSEVGTLYVALSKQREASWFFLWTSHVSVCLCH